MTRLFRVSLLASERTVPGGTATTTWLYFAEGQWNSVKDHPRATLVRLDCGPGTLWQTRAEFELEPSSWLQRVDRSPNRKYQPKDPLEYLRREIVRQRYEVQRSFFRVSIGGRLLRRPREEAPLDAEFDSDG